MRVDLVPGYAEFRIGPESHAYNEAAFRHFLAIDRRRAARNGRSILLVLVNVRPWLGPEARLTDNMAAAVFRGLGGCVREVDYVGWYRGGRIAAAVLSQGVRSTPDVPRAISERLIAAFRYELPAHHSNALRVRVVRLGCGSDSAL